MSSRKPHGRGLLQLLSLLIFIGVLVEAAVSQGGGGGPPHKLINKQAVPPNQHERGIDVKPGG